MKTLFVASEALPFITTGGMGEVIGALPKALRKRFVGANVVLPFFSDIPLELREKATYLTNFSVALGWRNQYCGIFRARIDGVCYYLIDNEQYFKRQGIYGHYDDGERFAFFCKAVLEMLQHIDLKPDVIHCNDWQSALTPVYYRLFYHDLPGYENISFVYTIHNLKYQGKYGIEILEDVFGIGKEWRGLMEYKGCINLMKAAIEVSDRITTVSPTYAQEIKDKFYGEGLENVIRRHGERTEGILNGIDTELYDPFTDPMIFTNYNGENIADKVKNKAGLQRVLGLEQNSEAPLMAMVTRLTDHKGIDLVMRVLGELMDSSDLQMVVVGTGEKLYEDYFKAMHRRYPRRLHAAITFNHELAHRVYAGADLFLMPSLSEPCGLSQMIALRYGTLPIVRETGGLKDTVQSYNEFTGEGNGFSFTHYNAHDMLATIRRALSFYRDPVAWNALRKKAMEEDFTWRRSAGAYLNLYRIITGKR